MTSRHRLRLAAAMNLPHTKSLARLPLDRLTDDDGVFGTRLCDLTFDELEAIMRDGPVRLAIASLGARLRWIANVDLPAFWQTVLPNIVRDDEEAGLQLDDYPGHFAYAASEWCGRSGERIVLLELYH